MLKGLFGKANFDGISFPSEDNIAENQGKSSESAKEFIENLRMSIGLYQLLKVVKSKDALETLYLLPRFLRQLLEDNAKISPSLSTFLQAISTSLGPVQQYLD